MVGCVISCISISGGTNSSVCGVCSDSSVGVNCVVSVTTTASNIVGTCVHTMQCVLRV